ncbi:MAG: glycosyltransferase [Parvularculaceae bacterium]
MPSYAGGGAEAIGFFLVDALIAAGLAVDLVVARGHGPLKDRPAPGARKVDLGAITEILAAPRWLKYLQAARPRCVLSMVHTANLTAGVGAARQPETPVIATFHNALQRAPKDQWWFRRVFGFGPERRLYRRMARMVAVSEGLAGETAATFDWPADKVRCVHNAPLRVPAADATVSPTLEPIFEKPVVLATGRLVAQKDFALLLTAFARIRDRTPANLLILGDGDQRARLEALRASLGLGDRAFLPGFTAHPEAYMRRAAAFAISSRYEGFSLVCVEAMACGAPIVSTDCRYGPGEILDGGRFGRLTPVGDVDAFAAALLETLNEEKVDRAARVAEREGWLARYRPERMAGEYVALIRDVLAETADQLGDG